jgi:hypothetical protein
VAARALGTLGVRQGGAAGSANQVHKQLLTPSSLMIAPIHAFGNEATRQKYLPRLAGGEWIGRFDLTEPDHIPDPGGYGVARWLVNPEVVDTCEVTHDIRALILGRALTG